MSKLNDLIPDLVAENEKLHKAWKERSLITTKKAKIIYKKIENENEVVCEVIINTELLPNLDTTIFWYLLRNDVMTVVEISKVEELEIEECPF